MMKLSGILARCLPCKHYSYLMQCEWKNIVIRCLCSDPFTTRCLTCTETGGVRGRERATFPGPPPPASTQHTTHTCLWVHNYTQTSVHSPDINKRLYTWMYHQYFTGSVTSVPNPVLFSIPNSILTRLTQPFTYIFPLSASTSHPHNCLFSSPYSLSLHDPCSLMLRYFSFPSPSLFQPSPLSHFHHQSIYCIKYIQPFLKLYVFPTLSMTTMSLYWNDFNDTKSVNQRAKSYTET